MKNQALSINIKSSTRDLLKVGISTGGAAGRVSAKYMPFAGAEKILASTFTCERKIFFGMFLICGADICLFHPCIILT